MNTKYYKSLEYDKIINQLENFCRTYIGKLKAGKLFTYI